jgi:hypothetical protein
MNEVRAKFGKDVTVLFKPLRDSAIACQGILEARDCDAVIVWEGPYDLEPKKRYAGTLRWMSGANRHPTLADQVPIPPYRCSIETGLVRCRISMLRAIMKALTVHFHSQAAAHM